MIKKLNLALVVVFAALIGLKMISDAGDAPKRRPSASAVQRQEAVSQLAPTVYYVFWAGYAAENPISRRNGYFLDLVRAIFPKANFRGMMTVDELETSGFLKDPFATYIYEAAVASNVQNCAISKSPLCWRAPCLWLLRTNDWHYDGSSNALKNVRVGFPAALESPATLDMLKAKGLDDARLKTYPESADMLAELKKKEIDAFVGNSPNTHQLVELESVGQRISCRCTPPLGKIYMHLVSSGADPAFTEALLNDYEAGLKRIEASGERRRIAEYYGFDPNF